MEAVRIEAARAALNRGVRDLAERASVVADTATRVEHGADAGPSTLDASRWAVEAACVVSISENGEGPRVTLRWGAQPS